MLRRYLFAGTIVVASLFQGWAAAAQQLTAGTAYVWVNELGSKMTTSWGTDGLITGTYVSAVGCGAGTVRPLSGWWNNAAMTFTVNWQACNSLTSWTGNYNAGTIATLWLLTVSGPRSGIRSSPAPTPLRSSNLDFKGGQLPFNKS